MNRSRILYAVLIVLTVIAGLASRRFSGSLPWIDRYAGDALWALMVFFLIGFVFSKKSTLWVATFALLFSFGIEISQFYHAPWIDTIRATKIGGLILGFGFLWSDLICYTVGVGVGAFIECIFVKKRKK